MSDEQSKLNLFAFSIGAADTSTVIISQNLKLQASVDALSVLMIEMLSQATGSDPIKAAERLEQVRENLLIKLAADLQEIYPPPSQDY